MKNIPLRLWIAVSLVSLAPLSGGELKPQPPGTKTDWAVHPIETKYQLPNSLGPGDFNKDGFTDYVVIHEGRAGNTSIVFHPGKSGDVRKPWPIVVMPKLGNAENADAGDFDGDGNLDIVIVEAGGPRNDTYSRARFQWGPTPDRVMDPSAWTASEAIPDSVDVGHWLWVQARDLNGDGITDFVAGGRRHESNHSFSGIRWFEAPRAVKDRRDLSKWVMHDLAPGWLGGHGFIFADIDGDGDDDIVDCNSDWDTGFKDMMVGWMENPGKGPELRKTWKVHSIAGGRDFYPKAQVAVADMNGDGRLDALIQGRNHLYIYFQLPGNEWEKMAVLKPEPTRFLARPTAVADLNGNGKLVVIGGLLHEAGFFPEGKASVFWMEHEGDKPTPDNWTTHAIRWGDYSNGVRTGKTNKNNIWVDSFGQGEKWDNFEPVDVDGDGDLDLVANVEEHGRWNQQGAARDEPLLGVVWFENPLKKAGAPGAPRRQ